ncbi:UbiD family decarboxylase [Pseudomassariella vexata]|uniref:UbiD family decarboxylase n=1 Tax=Pseudomassariella vexata TaxID=1141098 RepID=A0A1Y2DV30_9PEZI|nr:UbiD family decarboxylase [Pseudomassariella vexata]ORY62505.1 UbiD family decarboxylase [Pseudomassariella vexata]
MSLAILSDEDIRNLFESLTHDEVDRFQQSLRCALHEYSTGTQSIEEGQIHQPDRTTVHSNLTNATTLFMPSMSPNGHGVKVVTISKPQLEDPEAPSVSPTGSLTLFSKHGAPVGFLHAKTLTAFRTALASTCLLTKRAVVRTLTVFGSGLQAYWHIRLALMLRGSTIRTVNIINRQFSDNAKFILKKFYAVAPDTKRREGWEACEFSILTPGYGEFGRLQKEHIRAADVIYCCTPSTEPLFDARLLTSHEGRRKGRLIVAIGSYTPEMKELPTALLEQATRPPHGHAHFHKHATEGGVVVVDTLDGAMKEAGEIIEAGLEPRQLVELGELVMIQKARLALRDEHDSTYSRTSTEISSDMEKLDLTPGSPALSAVFGSENGNNPPTPSPPRRSPSHTGSNFFRKRRTSSTGSVDRSKERREDHLSKWLTSGNVIYKSVGLGLMDLVVGMDVVNLAREKGVGSYIENFS